MHNDGNQRRLTVQETFDSNELYGFTMKSEPIRLRIYAPVRDLT